MSQPMVRTGFKTGTLVLLSLLMIFPAWGKEASAPKLTVLQCFKIYENLLTGHIGKNTDRIKKAIAEKEKEIEGLDFAAVVPWDPKDRDKVKRFMIEKLDMDFLGQKLPTYDKSQKVGKAKMNVKEIRWSQANCRNSSQDKRFTVINNAKALKEGTLKVETLPTIRVWKDTDGKVWTLDHRRLAAIRLSGVVDEIPVEFVDEATVIAQQFKFGTRNDGKSIFVQLDGPEEKEKLSIVLINED